MEDKSNKIKVYAIIISVLSLLIIASINIPLFNNERYFATGFSLAQGEMYSKPYGGITGSPNDVIIYEEHARWFTYPIFFFAMFFSIEAFAISIFLIIKKRQLECIYHSGFISMTAFTCFIIGCLQSGLEYFIGRGYAVNYGILLAIIGGFSLIICIFYFTKIYLNVELLSKHNDIKEDIYFFQSVNFGLVAILFTPFTCMIPPMCYIQPDIGLAIFQCCVISFIFGLITLITGILRKDADPRMFWSRILGIIIVLPLLLLFIIFLSGAIVFS